MIKDLSPTKGVAAAELANRIFFRFFQAANTLHKQGTKALGDLGVTTHQWSVLGALSRPQAADGMSVGDLSRFLLMSRQNLTGILSRLERQRLIERVPGPSDRRTRRVRLTAAGEKLWRKLGPPIHRFYDEALRGFAFEDRVEFLHYLNRLQGNMSRL